MLLLAVVMWRRPAAGAAALTLAGWFKLAPFVLLAPFLAPLRHGQLARALAAATVLTAAALGIVVGVGGLPGVRAMVHAVGWQLERGSPQSLWAVLGIGALQSLAQAATLGLVAAAAVRHALQPELGRDRARVAALLAALLLALQLSADYWAFLYTAWIVPLLCLSLLADGEPAEAAEQVSGRGRSGRAGAAPEGRLRASRSTSAARQPIHST
jgi:hypothetical protein